MAGSQDVRSADVIEGIVTTKNYIRKSSAEKDATGFVVYADGAAIPVDGVGGAPGSTFAISQASPLRGDSSYLWTKSGNRLGEGFSYDFTIDVADKTSILQGSFEYKVASGTYADDDLIVYIYDVTNAAIIYPNPSKIKNSSLTEKFSFEFQTSNSTQYRFLVHQSTSAVTAYTMAFESFAIGKLGKQFGSISTDWVSYTPTYSGMGTTSGSNAMYRRNGANLEVNGTVTTGTVSGIHSITIPAGLAIDSSKLSISNNTNANPGQIVGTYGQSATNAQGYLVTAPGTANNLIYVAGNAGASATAITPTGTSLGSSSQLSFNFIVPIVGWPAQSQIISFDADSRVIAMYATGAPANVTTGNPIIFPTITKDPCGIYNNSTGRVTIQVPGFYQVNAAGFCASGTACRLQIYQNAVAGAYIGNTNSTDGSFVASGVVYAIAGDLIDLRPNAAMSSFVINTSFSINRISGPSQIAASESIYAKYSDSSAASISAAVAVYKFLTKEVDSHNSYSTSTGLWTCQASGVYKIDAHLSHVTNLSTSQQCDIIIYKNGASIKRHTMFGNATATRKSLILSDLVRLVPGDTIGIYASSDVATNAVNDVQYNSFSICRIGV